MTLNILTFQKEKTNFLKTESVSEKDQIYVWIVNPFELKIHLTLKKTAWEAKNAIWHMRQEYLPAIETISKYKWTNALGFELQSASNLYRDKKNNFLNFKVHQTCTGTKKQKFRTSKWAKPV